ncbi:DUF4190 domain-containing protein [Actinomadura latina]|uniref:DUF4190 domain-containing protein n=1 Tax=Actinomadura latina TaxID=163603 RepID=A0A846Z6N4_9ACTN|nr:DUF4190 domain-containing protein [Actinomadura latina]NKZ05826.1 DUF4190 domain-containing protein [Actinomadura latina]
MAYPPPGPGYPGSQPPYPPPPPPGPGYGSPYGNDKTNGLAVAAFVTGLLGCFGVLGLILGAIALSQIGRNGGRGRGFAIAGIIFSCLWIVTGVTIGVIAANSDSSGGDRATPSVTRTKPKEVDAKKMKLGDCINDNTAAANPSASEPVEVESVKIVPCTSPHDGEVTAVFRLSGSTLPPEAQLRRLASDGCKIRTRARISRDPAAGSLANSYYYPTDDSWRQGDRSVTCVAVAADEGTKLTRPLQR